MATARASSVVSSVALPPESREQSVLAPSSSAERSSPVLTPELREELVRSAMSDIRQVLRHMVDAAVERAIEPLLERQQALEAALKELRSRPEHVPGPSPARAVDVATPPRSSQVEPLPAGPSPSPTQTTVPAVPTRSRAAAAVLPVLSQDWGAVVDIPAELDGSRRKRTIAWSVGVVALLAVLCMAGLSVLSNMGIRL
jgi:hypothetical protein